MHPLHPPFRCPLLTPNFAQSSPAVDLRRRATAHQLLGHGRASDIENSEAEDEREESLPDQRRSITEVRGEERQLRTGDGDGSCPM